MATHHRTFRSHVPATAEALYAWHANPAAFQRLAPPWVSMKLLEEHGTINEGDFKRFRISIAGPLGIEWEARHSASPDLAGFNDTQVRGPFAAWHHEHRFIPAGAEGSLLEDRLTYALPLGAAADRLVGGVAERQLERMFTLRHRRTRMDLRRAARPGWDRPRRIAVSGASGLVGSRLVPFLRALGHDVRRLTRDNVPAADAIAWDPARGTIDRDALEGLDAVIHLAGANIAGGRWTARRMSAIHDSRVNGTSLLAHTLAGLSHKPEVFVSASAVGYYGNTHTAQIEDDGTKGSGFLAGVCAAWEAAADPARQAGIRVVHPRFGIVLAGEGGMLPLLARVFRSGAGGQLGDGRQYLSWVALDDLVGILGEAVMSETLVGPVNAVSPQPVTNQEFTAALGGAVHRPTIVRTPAAVARLVGGQLADELLLTSQRAVPTRLTEIGFPLEFSTIDAGIRHELGLTRPNDVPGGDA